jgi:chitinase
VKLTIRSFLIVLFLSLVSVVINTTFAHSSAGVTLRWDANDPAPEGYRVFAREADDSYDYDHPLWEKNLTTCSLTGLTEGVTYYFIVRAYEGELESVDSEEVSYTPPVADADIEFDAGTDTGTDTGQVDSDGDNVIDSLDLFPNDPAEWADNDHDGIGNTQDMDDDNDGMTDDWEIDHGLNPLVDDAGLDADGDGVANLDEFLADSETTTSSNNNAPAAPVVDNASEAERVNLTPVLVCGTYFDSDNDDHYQTRWQISTDSDFTTLILNATSKTQLYSYTVGEMVLDADTVYYWRVQFVDTNNQASDWSETATFTTLAIDAVGDADLDGMLDTQEADETSDVNENGIADSLENNIMTINTIEGQATVGVETLSDKVVLVSIKSLSTETIADQSVKLGFGLIGFKLYLQGGVKTASVKIHFSKQVPKNAKLYKYTAENGWTAYENAVFATNRKSVTLVLEDGGIGDEDGVENGVIVDPSGIAYEEDSTTTSDSASVSTGDASTGGGGGGCFISTGTAGLTSPNSVSTTTAAVMTILLLILGVISAAAVQLKKIDRHTR